MMQLLVIALVPLCLALTPLEAFALGADHPSGPVSGPAVGSRRWPAGLTELVNRPNRVHGYWVNEVDVFFFDGDSAAFNEFIAGYSKLANTTLRVVLHPGAATARSPWDTADRAVPVAWTLHISFRSLGENLANPSQGRLYTRVDLWLGSQVKLDQLSIPAEIDVISGGEIEKFLSGRRRAESD